jgi:NAD(P)H dehydrogenase (quinone)
MIRPQILVTAAAGQTGSAVTRQLLAAGFPVRAVVRRIDPRAERLRAAGAEIVVADMGDPLAMGAALVNVQRAYFVAGFDPAMLHQAVVFATAAAEARLEHVVQMTQWLASPSHPALMTRQHWLADRLVAMIPGATNTLVEPGFFADLPYLATLPYAAHLGAYPWPFRGGRNAPPSVEDIAAVVVGALTDPARHAGHRYRPTGPALLDGPEMAAIIGKVLGRRVRLAPMPFALFLRAARLDGLPMALLAMLRHYADDHGDGAFELGAPTDVVERVAGRPAESFESVTSRHAATLPRGFGPTLRQFARFMAVPLVPAPPVRQYLAGLRMPAPPEPLGAARSAIWRRDHRIDAPLPRAH